jgi:hypothetical protein
MKLMTWSAGKWQSTRVLCRRCVCLAMSHAPAPLLTSTSVFLRSFSIGYSFCPFEGSRISVFRDTCRPRRCSPCALTPVFQIFIVELQSDPCHTQGGGAARLFVCIALALSSRLMLSVSASEIF